MSTIISGDPSAQASAGVASHTLVISCANLTESKSTKKRKKKGAKNQTNGGIDEGKVVSATREEQKVPCKAKVAEDEESGTEGANQDALPQPQTTVSGDLAETLATNGTQKASMWGSTGDTDERFEALVKERDALRVQVTQLRQSLEELQANHQANLDTIHKELQETQTEKEHAEEQYQTLLGRVNTIKAQLGDRLKADAVGMSIHHSKLI